jgi:hypothetical protein
MLAEGGVPEDLCRFQRGFITRIRTTPPLSDPDALFSALGQSARESQRAAWKVGQTLYYCLYATGATAMPVLCDRGDSLDRGEGRVRLKVTSLGWLRRRSDRRRRSRQPDS